MSKRKYNSATKVLSNKKPKTIEFSDDEEEQSSDESEQEIEIPQSQQVEEEEESEDEVEDWNLVKKSINLRRIGRGIQVPEEQRLSNVKPSFDPKSLEEKNPKYGAIYKITGTCLGFHQKDKKSEKLCIRVENMKAIISQANGEEPSDETTMGWYRKNRDYLPSMESIKSCLIEGKDDRIKIPVFNHTPKDDEANAFESLVIKDGDKLKLSCVYKTSREFHVGDVVTAYNVMFKNKRKKTRETDQTWFLNCQDIKLKEAFEPKTKHGLTEIVDKLVNVHIESSSDPVTPLRFDAIANKIYVLPSSTEYLVKDKKRLRTAIEDIITMSSGRKDNAQVDEMYGNVKPMLSFAMQAFIQYKKMKGWIDIFCTMWEDVTRYFGIVDPWTFYLLFYKNHIRFVMTAEANTGSKSGASENVEEENNLVKYKKNPEMRKFIMNNPSKTVFKLTETIIGVVPDLIRTMEQQALKLDLVTAVMWIQRNCKCSTKNKKAKPEDIIKKKEFEINSDQFADNFINRHPLGSRLGIINAGEFTGDIAEYFTNWTPYLYFGGIEKSMDDFNEQCRVRPSNNNITPRKEDLWKRKVDMNKVVEAINAQVYGEKAKYTSVLWMIRK